MTLNHIQLIITLILNKMDADNLIEKTINDIDVSLLDLFNRDANTPYYIYDFKTALKLITTELKRSKYPDYYKDKLYDYKIGRATSRERVCAFV